MMMMMVMMMMMIIIIIIIIIAELAATKKEDKYSGLAADYLFQPIAVEILGPINESASDFLSFLLSSEENQPTFWRRAGDCIFVIARFRARAAI